MAAEVWNCGKFTYKVQFNTKWMLIFQHNTSKGIFSQKTAELNFEKGKFSYLSRISDPTYVKRFDQNYEFLLEYPVEFSGQFNHWFQSKDPLSEWDKNETGVKATGFEEINLSWKTEFGGLMRNHYKTSLLDGQTGTWNWNYAIGDWDPYYIVDGDHKTPGIVEEDQIYIHVSSIYLWIRIASPICQFCTQMKKSQYSLFSSFLFIILPFS